MEADISDGMHNNPHDTISVRYVQYRKTTPVANTPVVVEISLAEKSCTKPAVCG